MRTLHADDEIPTAYTGHEMLDAMGDKIGVVEDVIYDVETQEPRWAVVKRGLLHPRPAIVPLRFGYRTPDGAIVVPYDKRLVTTAPKVGKDHVITDDNERELRSHYGG